MQKNLRRAQEGVAHLLIVVIIALFAVGGAGYYVYSQQAKDDSVATEAEGIPSDIDEDEDPTAANGDDSESNSDDTGDSE